MSIKNNYFNDDQELLDDFVMPFKDLNEQSIPIPITFDEYSTPEYAPQSLSLDKCENCIIRHECEIMEEYQQLVTNNPESDISLYKKADIKGCTIGKHFRIISCGDVRVADGIGDGFKSNINGNNFDICADDKIKWRSAAPVFISAQTGQGKNYFIENCLLPYVREQNYRNHTDHKVLIVSNRIALRQQIESRLNYSKYHHDEQDQIYPYRDWDCAEVITYQSLLDKADYLKGRQRGKISSYRFIICDETHFFTTDAMFNPDTGKILSSITAIFNDVIRIYMSATPYDCLKYICEYEAKWRQQPELGLLYHFKRDYSYLDIKYYSNHNELRDLIARTVNENNERWLIFIDNIDKGKKFKSKLEEVAGMQGKVMAVNVSSKHDRRYQEMVLHERFDDKTNVLISTSVLDNGVNFRGINNIVVSDISRVKCLQMVGRARIGNNDNITLYIKRFSEKDIERKLNFLEIQRDAYHDYDLMAHGIKYKEDFEKKYYHSSPQNWENAKHWFGRIQSFQLLPLQNQLYPNEIARSLADELVEKYRSILDEMQKTNKEQGVPGQNYLEYQLGWFGKIYDSKNDITFEGKDRDKNDLIEFLEFYAVNSKQLFKDENDGQEKFSKEFTKLQDRAFGRQDKNQDRNYGISKMNEILKKTGLGYMIESITIKKPEGKKQCWIVSKVSKENLK